MSDLRLDPHELNGPGVQKIKRYLEERLTELREHNDHESDPQHTADTRGRIAEVKALLDLAKPAP
jgi:hypothetical protein